MNRLYTSRPYLSLRTFMVLPILLCIGVLCSATCIAQLVISPKQLEFTECVQAGKDTITKTLRLENRSLTDSIRIDGVFTEKTWAFRAFQQVRSFGPGTSTEIEVKFTPKFPGKYNDRLTIRWSLKGVEKVAVEVNLSGQAELPWIELFPNSSGPGPKKPILDTVSLGDTTFRQLILRNPADCLPFPVTSVELEDGGGQFFLAHSGAIPRSIPSNSFDTLLIGIVPRQIGKISAKLKINHPQDDRLELEIWLDAVVVRTKYVIRPRDVDFRDVSVGTVSPEQRISISVLGADNKQFSSIQLIGANTKDFQFTAPPLPYRLNRGINDSLTIGVECTPSATGSRSAELQFRTEDGDVIRIPLNAIGKDDGFTVFPRLLDIGQIAVGDTITLDDTILISKLQPSPASIARIRIDGPDADMFAITGDLPANFNQPNQSHRFSVQFIPKRAGNCFAQASFLLPNNERIRVELRGEGITVARSLDWIPATTDFGNVRLDSTRTLRFGLVNRGNTREQINTVQMEGGAANDFRIAQLNLPTTLRPFAADTLWSDVSFTPPSGGSRTASIRATAVSGTTSALLLQGTGEIRDLTVTPFEVDFGDIENGKSVTATDTIVLTNTGSTTIAVTGISIEGDAAGVFALQGASDIKLTTGNRTTYSLTFAPNSVNSFSAQVVITLSDGAPIRIGIRGRSLPRAPQLQLINTPAEFGLVQISTISQPILIGITNLGEATGTINSVELTNNPNAVFTAQLPAANQQLRGLAADTLWIPVTFAPVAATTYQAELSLNGFGETAQIQLRGEGTINGVGADPIYLDLGSVMKETRLDATNALVVNNRTTNSTEVTSFRWVAGDSTSFIVTGSLPAIIAPSARALYSVVFFPNQVKNYRAEGMFLLRNGGAIPVTITGSGSLPPFVYLDTAYRKVNEKFDLRLYISASPGTTAAGNGYTARIRFNPASLLLTDVAGRGVSWKRLSAGIIEVTSTDPSALAGVELARLTMEGLVTGEPENEVVIEEFTLLTPGTILVTSPGKVFLDGCQIDQAALFGRPAAISGLFPSPASTGATLRFTAPEGTRPVAVFIDPTGRDVETIQLPEGTGEETETMLTFDTVGSGFYFLELRLGTQRSVVPIMISR